MLKQEGKHISKLISEIEQRIQWGNSQTWTGKDFENLVDIIYTKTNQKLSVTTLKRLWGRATGEVQPSITTLDILSKYLDYDSWRIFTSEHSSQQKSKRKTIALWAKLLPIFLFAIGSFVF